MSCSGSWLSGPGPGHRAPVRLRRWTTDYTPRARKCSRKPAKCGSPPNTSPMSGWRRRSPSCSTAFRCSCWAAGSAPATSTATCEVPMNGDTPDGDGQMLRVAVPNKGTLAEPASEMLAEAGYRQRHDPKDLTVIDAANEVEFFFLRPRDISVYVGYGELDLGITGRDLALDSAAPVSELLALGFGGSTFRYAAPLGRDWKVDDLDGLRVATAYPRLVKADLARHGVHVDVIRLDGAVEISVELGSLNKIADVVGSGRTLRQHGLAAFGDPICSSEAVLLQGTTTGESPEKAQLSARLQGVVFAQQYLMLDYDCPRSLLDDVVAITPGLESPTVSSLADPSWVAVRAMVPRRDVNRIMDQLSALGARAILASDI